MLTRHRKSCVYQKMYAHISFYEILEHVKLTVKEIQAAEGVRGELTAQRQKAASRDDARGLRLMWCV